jgi:hypothetical protein
MLSRRALLMVRSCVPVGFPKAPDERRASAPLVTIAVRHRFACRHGTGWTVTLHLDNGGGGR